MTVYAASSLVAVNLSVEGHGGCGEAHIRPVVDGAPKKIWDLTCSHCENHLRSDPLWSTNPIEIPETHDEKITRERSEKTGKLDRDNQMQQALIELSQLGQLPEVLTKVLMQLTGATPVPAVAGMLECVNGHATAAPAKFCAECAAPLSTPARAAAITAPGAQEPPATGGPRRRLRDARLEELQKLARDRGLDPSGKRPELVTRLSNAGVTSNDLAA